MKLPDDSQRITIYGKTGSGKTIAALWHLSERSITSRPWIIFDFKGDKSLARLDAMPLGTEDELPVNPGLYIVRPVPEVDDESVETMMWRIWQRGGIGVYIDEGYMVGPRNKAFKALLTQGRSKSIPMITLTQRPVWMSKFVISEADFHQVFFLSNKDDRKTVQDFIPYDITKVRLPKYHSYYYDVDRDVLDGLKPVPNPSQIVARIRSRLEKMREELEEKFRKEKAYRLL